MKAVAEEATAKAAKARADTIKTIADAELKRAQTKETIAGIDREDLLAAEEILSSQQQAASVQPQQI